jgi:copper chaperone CopZ
MAEKQATIPVLGISCASCVKTVERALNDVPGVWSVTVYAAGGRASVIYDRPRRVAPVVHVLLPEACTTSESVRPLRRNDTRIARGRRYVRRQAEPAIRRRRDGVLLRQCRLAPR